MLEAAIRRLDDYSVACDEPHCASQCVGVGADCLGQFRGAHRLLTQCIGDGQLCDFAHAYACIEVRPTIGDRFNDSCLRTRLIEADAQIVQKRGALLRLEYERDLTSVFEADRTHRCDLHQCDGARSGGLTDRAELWTRSRTSATYLSQRFCGFGCCSAASSPQVRPSHLKVPAGEQLLMCPLLAL